MPINSRVANLRILTFHFIHITDAIKVPWQGKTYSIISFVIGIFLTYTGVLYSIGAFTDPLPTNACATFQFEWGLCTPVENPTLMQFMQKVSMITVTLLGLFRFFIAYGFFKGKRWLVVAGTVLTSISFIMFVLILLIIASFQTFSRFALFSILSEVPILGDLFILMIFGLPQLILIGPIVSVFLLYLCIASLRHPFYVKKLQS